MSTEARKKRQTEYDEKNSSKAKCGGEMEFDEYFVLVSEMRQCYSLRSSSLTLH